MEDAVRNHDFWPTKQEIETFVSRSPNKMPPMEVEIVFEKWVANRLGIEVIGFDVPAGFRLPEWVNSLNKDCEVTGKMLQTTSGKPMGMKIEVVKAEKRIYTVMGAYKKNED